MAGSAHPSPPQTLLDVLQWRAAEQSDDEAYTFLLDGQLQEASITYGELFRRARGIGAQLLALGGVGERAIILCPAGLDYIAAFFGCICSGLAAVPLYAPDLSKRRDTIRAIVRSSGPCAGIATWASHSAVQDALGKLPELATLPWIMADDTPAGSDDSWRAPEIGPRSIALFTYTSGSTSTPRGVPKLHQNYLHASSQPLQRSRPTAERVVNWVSPSVTMCQLMGMILPLYRGVPCTHMAPESFLERPARWIEAMSHTHATESSAPSFAYDLAVAAIPPDDRPKLDLSAWHTGYIGAEMVRAETIERFEAAFAASGLRRGVVRSRYGLTEATGVVYAPPDQPPTILVFDRRELEKRRVVPLPDGSADGRKLVDLGRPGPGVEILSVDPERCTPVGPGEIGELWTRGPHVSNGYWNDPEATREVFGAYLEDGRGPYLRTGDLGFFHDRQMFITGRLKEMIIIRGRNVPATDVEAVSRQSHPAVQGQAGAAFAVEAGGEEQLVLVQEVAETDDLAAVAHAIWGAIVVEVGVRAHAVVLVPIGAIPRAPLGKVLRAACRTAYLEDTLPSLFVSTETSTAAAPGASYTPPGTDTERALVAIWESVLGVSPIGIHDDFIHLGGDSLKSLQVQGRMRTLGMQVSMSALHRSGTIAVLAQSVEAETAPTHSQEPLIGPVPLLLAQYSELDDDTGRPFRPPRALALTAAEPTDPALLEEAARAVIFHHDVLRMRFQYIDDMWEAECVATTPGKVVSFWDISYLPPDLQAAHMDEEVERLRDRISVDIPILLQIAVFRRGAELQDRIVLVLPHVVYDAVSTLILVEDLETAYSQLRAGSPIRLPPKTTNIREWGEQLDQLAASGGLQSEIPYWLDVLQEGAATIPPDMPDQPDAASGIMEIWAELDRETTSWLQHVAPAECGFQIIDALLYAVARSVSVRTGESSVLLEARTHGREPLTPTMDLSRTLGFFTSEYPVRISLDDSVSRLDAPARLHQQLGAVPLHGVGFTALRFLCAEERCNVLRAANLPIRINYTSDREDREPDTRLFRREANPAAPDGDTRPQKSTEPKLTWPGTAWTDALRIRVSAQNGMLRLLLAYHGDAYTHETMDAFTTSILDDLTQIACAARR